MAPPAPVKTGTRVSRPAARYRPGKAPLGAGADDYSDSDEDNAADHHEKEQAPQQAARIINVSDLSSGVTDLASQRKTAGIVVSEAGPSGKKIDLRLQPPSQTADGDDLSEYETDTDDEPAPAKPVFRKPCAPVPAPPQAQPNSGSSEYETDSLEEEESEDEPAPPPLLKPIFVPKSARTTIPADASEPKQAEVVPEAKAEEEAAKRRKEAYDLAAATIARSLAEKTHAETASTEVDDTDGLDPEAEFAAWKARELARIQRDLDALEEKRKEQAEIDAFKALPEAEKERLGRERAKQLREEKKEQRGNPAFMQKYYHKGSFFQDMDILKRDYTEKTEKDVDVSKLPKMMQVRNYGAKGRSKWTHLANEDTSKAAIKVDVARRERGCFVCGGDHLKRDCPRLNGEGGGGGSGSGANTSELKGEGEGRRRWGSGRDNDKEPSRGSERHRDRSRSPRRESSRSHRDEDGRRSRDSHDRERHRSSRRDRQDAHRHSSSHRDERDRDRHSRRHRDDDDDRRDRDRHRSHLDDRDREDKDRHRDRDREHRCKSDRHDSDHRKHDHGHDERDRHRRRDRDDHRRDHETNRRHSDEKSDRKRSRLDA